MVVLLITTCYRLFHILLVLMKKDDLNTCAGILAGYVVLSIPSGWCDVGCGWNAG